MSRKPYMATKTIAYSALLATVSIVMARLMSFAPPPVTRWSLDKFPLFLSGMFFGPLVGALTGFVADFVGSLMQYGFDPIYCLPPILFGLAGGLARPILAKKYNVLRLTLCYLLPVVLGSWLWQSFAIAYKQSGGGEALYASYLTYLGSRGIQFAIVAPLEIFITAMLIRSGMFRKLGVWPPTQRKRGSQNDDC